ncbi:hypothetical protein [Paeniglutamicibacter sp.]|uniref:hypothetical protein n=1 Tax=Paeniglutamicibacter sp. TaxID=1934391 RepID=UPI00398A4C01
MQDGQYQIEVALRLVLAGNSDGRALEEFVDRYSTLMRNFEVAPREQDRYPIDYVTVQFERIRSLLENKGIYLRNRRTGWESRTRRLLDVPKAIEDVDSADIVEALCVLGDLRVLPIGQWASKRALKGVHLLLKRLLRDLLNLSSVRGRVDEGQRWEWDELDSPWAESADNRDFGYMEVLRAINNSTDISSIPANPTGAADLPHYIRYWFTLSAIVVGHLGWRHPAVGIAAWINNGMQDDDAVMSGVKQLWGLYAASLLAEPSKNNLLEMASEVLQPQENTSTQARSYAQLDSPEEVRFRLLLQEKSESDVKWGAPNTGGSDPLHLISHVVSMLGDFQSTHNLEQSGATLLHTAVDSHEARASLLIESRYPWYSALTKWGDQIPRRHDGRSWRVDVTSKNYGYIGEFRRSSVTGLWFAGKHSSHMLGNTA